MKIATKIAGFLMSCVTLCASLQPVVSMAQNTEMARPRSTIDLSRTDRLTGTPSVDPTSVPSCPAGSTLSGGACVLISNQEPYEPSWTTFFPMQKKCNWQVCATVKPDGSIAVGPGTTGAYYSNWFTAPYGRSAVGFLVTQGNNCTGGQQTNYRIEPVLSIAQTVVGAKPYDWVITEFSVQNINPSGDCGI